jgi:hypothetical protein
MNAQLKKLFTQASYDYAQLKNVVDEIMASGFKPSGAKGQFTKQDVINFTKQSGQKSPQSPKGTRRESVRRKSNRTRRKSHRNQKTTRTRRKIKRSQPHRTGNITRGKGVPTELKKLVRGCLSDDKDCIVEKRGRRSRTRGTKASSKQKKDSSDGGSSSDVSFSSDGESESDEKGHYLSIDEDSPGDSDSDSDSDSEPQYTPTIGKDDIIKALREIEVKNDREYGPNFVEEITKCLGLI